LENVIDRSVCLKEKEPIHLFWLGDIHEGHCNVNYSALKKAVDLIVNYKKKFSHVNVFLMGDLIEAITHRDKKRFDPISIHEKYKLRDLKDLPKIQANNIIEILKPIKKEVRGIIVGNHEEKYIKFNSFDIYDYIASAFPHSQKLGYVGFYNYIFSIENFGGSYTVSILMNHGRGGSGSTRGYSKNILYQLFKWCHADISIAAHLHQLEVDRIIKRVPNIPQGRIDGKEFYYGVSGSFLSTYEIGNRHYFEHVGAFESPMGMLHGEIKYYRTRKQINGKTKASWHRKISVEPIYLE